MMTLEELHAHYKAVRARLDGGVKREAPVRLICPEPAPAAYPDPLDTPAPVAAIIEMPDKTPETPAETPARRILNEVADKHGMPPTTFRSKNRRMDYVLCRQEAAYRLNTELKFSLSQIGRLMGHRDHTTVLHAINRYKKNLAQGGGPWTRKSGVSSARVTQVEPRTQDDHV